MSNDAGLTRLRTHFGNQIDIDVLTSVLAVCAGNVNQAIQFLTAGEGDVVDDPAHANQEVIPRDYPARNPTGRVPVPAELPKNEENQRDPEITEKITKIKKLFVSESVLHDHFGAQSDQYPEYVACLLLLLHQGVELAKSARPRILASAWTLKNNKLCDYLLENFVDLFGLPDVLRALQLMDAPRKKRALEKRINNLQQKGNPKPKKMTQLRTQIADITKEQIDTSSVSGSLAKRIRKWVKTFSSEQLNFYALQLPREPWQELADIIHLCPGDFQCRWFLDVTFGKPVPEDSILKVCESLTEKNVVDILAAGHAVPYSYLRTHIRPLPQEAKNYIALYAPMDTLIWFHEELQTPQVDETISKRISSGEYPKFSYGKLMERLLYFKRNRTPFYDLLIPIAEKRLGSIELLLEPPVTVFGDGSYSMDVAIRTATIIASVLTVLTSAELKFFNVITVEPPCYPTNVREVIEVAEKVVADGLTAPAAALWPYYVSKKPVKFFVMVTDEVENGKFNNQWYFPDLFLRYYQEVYPAKIVFVSFLENPNIKGRMVTSLENMGIEVLQFRLDGKRPDLTKMDTLLGLLSSESSHFPQQVLQLAQVYKEGGLEGLVHRLNNPPERTQSQQHIEKIQTVERRKIEREDLPDHFCCPITLSLMKDPVITPSGHTYERSAILAHLGNSSTDPLTNEKLSVDDLRPNRALKDAIVAFCAKVGLDNN